MNKKLLFAVLLTAVIGCGAMAQSTFTLRLGSGMLYDDFGMTKSAGSGQQEASDPVKSPSIGFTFGAEWSHQIKAVDGLSFVLSLDGFYNGPTKELNEYLDKEHDRVTGLGADMTITRPSFLNFPLMLGAQYGYDAIPGIGIYTTLAAGANLRYTTPMTFEYVIVYDNSVPYGTVNQTIEFIFQPVVTFAFRLTAGMVFNDKYSVEMGYLNLGTGTANTESHETISSSVANTTRTNKASPVTNTPEIFTLSLGIRL
ncbi:MAG: hypothetical protein K6F85_03020 [Bacteroidales bacterium]|nr:hypothetical protein [Bacteroidales bacterium]